MVRPLLPTREPPRFFLPGRCCILQSSAHGTPLERFIPARKPWHPVRYLQRMPTMFYRGSTLRRMRCLPRFVCNWLQRAWRRNERSLNADFVPAALLPTQEERPLIYPVLVIDHSMITADARRAASRPAGMRLVLVDDDLEPSEISNAVCTAAATKGSLPMAVHVQKNDVGEVNVHQTRLTVRQATQAVHSVVRNSRGLRSEALRETRRSLP